MDQQREILTTPGLVALLKGGQEEVRVSTGSHWEGAGEVSERLARRSYSPRGVQSLP